jgi:hypothetical protein
MVQQRYKWRCARPSLSLAMQAACIAVLFCDVHRHPSSFVVVLAMGRGIASRRTLAMTYWNML